MAANTDGDCMGEPKETNERATKLGARTSHLRRRRCKAAGCTVVLSSYNKGEFCARHAHLAPIAKFRAS